MHSDRNPWENDYLRRGQLWCGRSISLSGLPYSSRILELGCGDGNTVGSLVRNGFTVTALDFSPAAALLCRNTCPDPDQARILIADTRKIPFCAASFDVIIASHITAHLNEDSRRNVAGEVFRLLVPGGILYFRDFSTADFRYGRGLETEAGTFTRKNGIATHYFSREEVLTLFHDLAVRALVEHQWEMRVRGIVLPRAEIVAEFKKPA
jgi:SAM-dependent methyltransferase